jgi:hypothetical protein
MRKLLFGVAALPFLAGIALAAEPLNEVQMDQIVAGAGVCSNNGVTVPCSSTPIGLCTGCTGGQVFSTTATSAQALLADLNAFLKAVGYSGSCSTPTC